MPISDRRAPQPMFWMAALCLVGLDYFSTLAYQPSIAFEVAGRAAPLATLVVVAATLCGALPLYLYIAGRSPNGQGATGMLERNLHGWAGKLTILVVLGFGATDFIVTRTLSAADAAEHLIHNPLPWWQARLASWSSVDSSVADWSASPAWRWAVQTWNKQVAVTVLLSILSFGFWAFFRKGFTRAVVRLAAVVVVIYLGLNGFVLAVGIRYLVDRPELLEDWWQAVTHYEGHVFSVVGSMGPSWLPLALLCLYAFPAMALGLSGFELSMVVMPLVRGPRGTSASDVAGRIRNTRKLLATAAVLMSLCLVGSSLVTTLLIPPAALAPGAPASNRALAYLAHGGLLTTGESADQVHPWFGSAFGTVYDLSTVITLCLVGASVTIGLRDLVPSYLQRFGMQLDWAHRLGVILHLFNLINVVVTLVFRASVEAQRGTYATSVLVVLSSGGAAALLDLRSRSPSWSRGICRGFFYILTVGFAAAALVAMVRSPVSMLIALCFVGTTIVTSIVSRGLRSTELRFEGFDFANAESQTWWDGLRSLEFPVLVPHRPGLLCLGDKERQIRARHRLGPEMPLVFLEADLGDASDFYQRPQVLVLREEGRYLVRITRCVSIPHVLAAAALELSRDTRPPELHFGWSNESPVTANLSFLLFGTGNIPWMVHHLLRKAEPRPERRPPVIVG